MSTTPQPLFDMSKATPIFDMSKAKPISSTDTDILRGASQATSLSADTRGPLQRAWDEVKAGLTAAQPGQGLKPQPTLLGNAAEFLGMGASTASSLMGPTEGAAVAGKASELVSNAIPNTEHAGQLFQNLSKSIGSEAVPVTDELSTSLNELRKSVQTTNTNAPQVVRKLIDRLDPFQGMGPLTYDEARSFSSEINSLSAGDKLNMTKNTLRLVQNLNGALKDAVQEMADLHGQGENLSKAMVEYRKAMQLSSITDAAKDALWKAALGAGATFGAGKIWQIASAGGRNP